MTKVKARSDLFDLGSWTQLSDYDPLPPAIEF